MYSVVLVDPVDFSGFRTAARGLALADIPPDQVAWSVDGYDAADLFGDAAPPAAGTFAVPRALFDLAAQVIQARDPARFALLYRLIWRVHRGEKNLLQGMTDPDTLRATRLAQSVRRDIHKMHAFVRFRQVAQGERQVAWFDPEHYTLESGAPFFVRRFATLRWSIFTPYRSADWDGAVLRFGPGANPQDMPEDDALAAYWEVYFRSIFNPARLKLGAMLSEMPKKYWRSMPEAGAIPDMIRGASARTQQMVDTPTLSQPRPLKRRAQPVGAIAESGTGVPGLAQAARDIRACRRCALWAHATQPVFGEGPTRARMMLVGEQPGDQEDLAGKPFIGPAGQLLDDALRDAGINRGDVYATNAVKHFKFVARGKRRIHDKPNTSEIIACNVWLDIERQQVRPAIMVLLGATAARAVLGRAVTIGKDRGQPMRLEDGTRAVVTVHPSFLLRLPDPATRQREYAAFVQDLQHAASLSRVAE